MGFEKEIEKLREIICSPAAFLGSGIRYLICNKIDGVLSCLIMTQQTTKIWPPLLNLLVQFLMIRWLLSSCSAY